MMRFEYSEEVRQECNRQLNEAMNQVKAAQQKLQETLFQELTRLQYKYIGVKTCEIVSYLEATAAAAAPSQDDLPMEAFAKACGFHEPALQDIQTWCGDVREQIRSRLYNLDTQALLAISTERARASETDFDLIMTAFQNYSNEMTAIAEQWEQYSVKAKENALTEQFGAYMGKVCFVPQAEAAKKGSAHAAACREHFVQMLNKADQQSRDAANSAGNQSQNHVDPNMSRQGSSGNSNSGGNNGGVRGLRDRAKQFFRRGEDTQPENGTQDPSGQPQGQRATENGNGTDANGAGNQAQEPAYRAIGLDWALMNNLARKLKNTFDPVERIDCFTSIYEHVYEKTAAVGANLSNAEEARSPEMNRLLDATRYALTDIAEPFLRLESDADDRETWWKASVADYCDILEATHGLGSARTGEEMLPSLADFSGTMNDHIRIVKRQPAEIVSAVLNYTPDTTQKDLFRKVKQAKFKNWDKYNKYTVLIDKIKDQPTVGMGLHVVSFILHDSLRYIQFGAHTSSLFNLKAWVGKGNEADQHIAFQFGPVMAALSHFANMLTGGTDDRDEQFFRSFKQPEAGVKLHVDGGLISRNFKDATLDAENMKYLMELDPDPASVEEIQHLALQLYQVISKYRFALENEVAREKMKLGEFHAGLDMAKDAVDEVLDAVNRVSKLGGPALEEAAGMLTDPIDKMTTFTQLVFKGEFGSLAKELFFSGDAANNPLLESLSGEVQEYCDWVNQLGNVSDTVCNTAELVSQAYPKMEKIADLCSKYLKQLEHVDEAAKTCVEDMVNSQQAQEHAAYLDGLRASIIAEGDRLKWNDALCFVLSDDSCKEWWHDVLYRNEPADVRKHRDRFAAAYLASVRWAKEHPDDNTWPQSRQAEEALRGLLGIAPGQSCEEWHTLKRLLFPNLH